MTDEERIAMLQLALQLIEDLLDVPASDNTRQTIREIIRHARRETQ